eukprot:5515080-Amphidinium_carterae.1
MDLRKVARLKCLSVDALHDKRYLALSEMLANMVEVTWLIPKTGSTRQNGLQLLYQAFADHRAKKKKKKKKNRTLSKNGWDSLTFTLLAWCGTLWLWCEASKGGKITKNGTYTVSWYFVDMRGRLVRLCTCIHLFPANTHKAVPKGTSNFPDHGVFLELSNLNCGGACVLT